MNDEQKGKDPQSQNGDKLDQWIEQTLQTDGKKPSAASPQTAKHQSSQISQNQPNISAQAPLQNQPVVPKPEAKVHHQQNQPQKPAAHQKPHEHNKNQKHGQKHQPRGNRNSRFTNSHHRFAEKSPRPHTSGHNVAVKPHNLNSSTQSHVQTNKVVHHAEKAGEHNQPKRKFFGLFGGRSADKSENKSFLPSALSGFKGVKPHYRGKLRLIPVGGLDEVGKNCMLLEYDKEIIIIDIGFQFPEDDMLGVDYVIPDLSYLDDKIDRVKAIFITHGHLDHVGGLPYVMKKLNFPPIYGTKLTNGLIEKRLEEFGLLAQTKLHNVTKDDVIQVGQFNVSFFHVNHSIPDAVGIVVKTPAGNIAHTGDFKFDFTPSGDQAPPDFVRLAMLANEDIAAFFIDSTNALKPGYTVSEKKIGHSLENIIKNTEGRILIASFSSQIGRIQQIVNHAKKYGKTIFTSGRSLADNIFIASKLGYLKVPQGLIQDIRKMGKTPEDKVIILTTGSQGEAVSALSRMALEDHPMVSIKKGDTVVLSSSPIPGNERAVFSVTNNLCKLGAHIINNQIMDVHTSGHAQQEDLKLMMNLVKSKSIVPIHGEYYMRYGLKEIATTIGYAEKNVLLVENGGVIEVQNGEAKATGETVETKYILIDGLGVGDIGAQIMMDRQTLAENGVLILVITVDPTTKKIKKEVDVISRGFIYMKESEELVRAIADLARDAYTRVSEKRGSDAKRGDMKKYIKETVDKFVHQKIERHPLVLPIIIEQ